LKFGGSSFQQKSEMLKLMAGRKPIKRLEQLYLSVRAGEISRESIFAKLSVVIRAKAVVDVARCGLISL
jgi:hypothetical protein